MTTELISAAELSVLIWRNRLREPDPCAVCGGEMIILNSDRSGATMYVCAAPAVAVVSPMHGDRAEVNAHLRASRQSIVHGNPQVAALARQMRQLRAERGEDMSVPAGEVVFPYGHGNYRCFGFLVHQGGDVWVEQADPAYTHDPSHNPDVACGR